MKFVILALSIWIFIRALSYGMYEIKENKNIPRRDTCCDYLRNITNIS